MVLPVRISSPVQRISTRMLVRLSANVGPKSRDRNRGRRSMTTLSSDLREALAKVGTSTLTGVLNRRGLRSMTLFDVWPLRPEQPRMVGVAFTMRFIPSREDMDGPSSKNRSMVQPQAMEECPPGHVLMIDSRGDSRAASAGDLYIGRLKARGAAGIVTDGGFRDTAGDA